MADPTLSAQTAETDLRELARLLLEPALGAEWVERSGVFTPEQIEKVKGRRSDEEGKRGGVTVEQSLIFYVDLWDLISIMKRHWQRFKKVLGPNKERWNQESQVLYNMRNAQAHGRTLVPFERDLLSGIAGDIRNRVTRYRSTLNVQNEWWPRIETVTDSFGNSVSPAGDGSGQAIVTANEFLELGQLVTFRCSGWDPHGRELLWQAGFGSPVIHGTDVEVAFAVNAQNFGGLIYAHILLSVPTPHHRQMNGVDEIATFIYNGRPPGV